MKYLIVLMLLWLPLQAQTLMLELEYDAAGHRLVDAWLLEQPLPAMRMAEELAGAVRFRVFDLQGELVFEGLAPKPGKRIAEPFLASTEELPLTGVRFNEQGSYILRLPVEGLPAALELGQIQWPDEQGIRQETTLGSFDLLPLLLDPN